MQLWGLPSGFMDPMFCVICSFLPFCKHTCNEVILCMQNGLFHVPPTHPPHIQTTATNRHGWQLCPILTNYQSDVRWVPVWKTATRSQHWYLRVLPSSIPQEGMYFVQYSEQILSIPCGGIVPGAVMLAPTRPPHSPTWLLEAAILTIILLPFYWWFYSHFTDDSDPILLA